ncbi:hypothetical protein CVT24_009783 [Panaeolus cyanescens]|uniref:cyclic pyranopterin monophosphate synthase n=1 Tax=Panaeolus cyanescens TaxID=181874 RepID=A0A409VAD6_9AGAR|nr:hypothetical protein CVT24_009783 [Panaeolus cyanescens]
MFSSFCPQRALAIQVAGRFGKRSLTNIASSTATDRAKARIAQIDEVKPFSHHLVDTYNRRHNYLRISLTERCFYCMPSEGIELSPDGKLLTNEEMLRLAKLFVRSGVTKIRLTGGEPTVRKGIVDIVASLNDLRQYGLESIGMTTNGLAMHRKLPELVEKGLTHLNLSLDTLDPFKFELITRRRGHDAVLKALDVACSLPLQSVKINVVVIKGLNDNEVLDFVEMSKHHPISVRFIEFMPFTGNKWDKNKMVESSELLRRIQELHPNAVRAPDELNDTARSWTIPGYQGSFGFISSMSDHFCGTCNRLRLTADGQIKVCLFDANEISLRDKLRSGASDEQMLELIGTAVSNKTEKHAGMEDIDVVTNRPMILIGGLRQQPSQRHVGNHTSTIRLKMSPQQYHRPRARAYSTKLTHLDDHGRPSMVDVGEKNPTKRTATASGRIYIPKIAYNLITKTYDTEVQDGSQTDEKALEKARRKGDALTVAQLAAIMGAKQTPNLIPLCHPLQLSKIDVKLTPEKLSEEQYAIKCIATVACEGKTGVEMEALTAVGVGLLTVWDMLKAVAGKEMEIGEMMVINKTGGKSGDFER